MTANVARFAHEANREDATFMLRREFMAFPIVASFSVNGEPISKARARFTNYGSKVRTFTPEKTRQGEMTMAAEFKKVAPNWVATNENIYGVFGIFFASTFQRRDVDNMLKLILDSLNKVAWADDAQVNEISGKKQVCPPGHERTEVLIYDMGPKPRNYFECIVCGIYAPTYNSWKGDKRFCSRTCQMAHTARMNHRECLTCGKGFNSPANKRQKYCSSECGYEARRDDVDCTQCGQVFSQQAVHVKSKNYCSGECRTAYLRAHPVTNGRGKCQKCGALVSRREYEQCNACKSEGKAAIGKPIITITDLGDAS